MDFLHLSRGSFGNTSLPPRGSGKDGQDGDNKQSTADMTVFVQNLLQQMVSPVTLQPLGFFASFNWNYVVANISITQDAFSYMQHKVVNRVLGSEAPKWLIVSSSVVLQLFRFVWRLAEMQGLESEDYQKQPLYLTANGSRRKSQVGYVTSMLTIFSVWELWKEGNSSKLENPISQPAAIIPKITDWLKDCSQLLDIRSSWTFTDLGSCMHCARSTLLELHFIPSSLESREYQKQPLYLTAEVVVCSAHALPSSNFTEYLQYRS
ncbi:hypothetical protein FXO38_36711 [Capsicum annuum]|nr:hypothetical protein FXO38_36711 [Capsicum annuum]